MMLKSQVHRPLFSKPGLNPPKFSPSHATNSLSFLSRQSSIATNVWQTKGVGAGVQNARNTSGSLKALFSIGKTEPTDSVTAVVKVKPGVEGLLKGIWDSITNLAGRALHLELVSTEIDPATGKEKKVSAYSQVRPLELLDIEIHFTFDVPKDFGEVGAIIVDNELRKEMYIKDITLNGLPDGSVTFTCNSWIASKFDNQDKRIFFTNKSALPQNTPSGLKNLRTKELENLRGKGNETRERKHSDRIYDYDKYNDLGSPDVSDNLARPVLGGKEHPYPRRCRTGGPPTSKDPSSEQRRLIDVYVPRDENFSVEKLVNFGGSTVLEALHALQPAIEQILVGRKDFPHFTAIDELFNQGLSLPEALKDASVVSLVPRLIQAAEDASDSLLLFEKPELFNRDKFSWLKDGEFSRQTLAGLNPQCIQLVTEWPLKSKLDPAVYGTQESAITRDNIEQQIKGIMTFDEALKQKKLFMLDYHDLLLPFVEKVRALEGTTLYGSRTLFFLTDENTLRPLAIELTRPPIGDKPQWRQVFTPAGSDATNWWLWKFAKLHVCAHDCGYHELVSHWLRTHCCVEPYIIATNRQLSAMHPVNRLLHPHFRYTMEINALARGALINAGGIIESAFSPGKYSMELSSAAYDKKWRFDTEALPDDLISRGIAVADPTAEHGLKLIIQDYPYANDGLLVWDAIKTWVSDYVNHYYPQPDLVKTDSELRDWWNEIQNKGHEDKKDEPWWPSLNTPDDLIKILTTIIWVTSCHHAAVNFGQYAYGGYFPNRPSIARTNMPNEDPKEKDYKTFLKKPEDTFMKCLPSQIQATKVMVILNVLSGHSTDEEYLGEHVQPVWSTDPIIKAAFEKFNRRLLEVDGIVDARNKNTNLKNRTGAGLVPYELLKPFSEHGVTGKGVPNSISI